MDVTEQLFAEITFGNLDKVDKLLSYGADIEAVDENGRTPLIYALIANEVEIAKLLLQRGANIEATDDEGRTPLMYAATLDNIEFAKLLLEHGADIEAADENQASSLIYATVHGNIQAVELLLEHGADPWMTVLYAKNNDDIRGEILQLLSEYATFEEGEDDDLQQEEDIINEAFTSLMDAATEGHFDSVKIFLQRGVDIEAVNEIGFTALMSAAFCGHTEIVKLLLENGADIEATAKNNGYTALMSASYKGHVEVVKLLLEYGADIDAKDCNGWTALTQAVRAENIESVRFLLEHGANINTQCFENGFTPLIEASYKGYVKVVKLLLENGASPSVIDKHSWTVLMYAARECQVPTMEVLLEYGADIDVRDCDGWTSLIQAVRAEKIESVRFLLEHGANVNAQGFEDGLTALISAVKLSNREITSLLLDYGANINAKTKNGETALNIAQKNESVAIVNLIEKFNFPMVEQKEQKVKISKGERQMENENRASSPALSVKTPVEIILELETASPETHPFSSSYYIRPNIPDKKLNGSIKKIAKEQVTPDEVLLVLDMTLFGSAENGILLTSDKLYYRDGEEIEAKYSDLKNVEYKRDVTIDKNGKERVSEYVIVTNKSGTFKMSSYINAKYFAEFIQNIMTSSNSMQKNISAQYIERKPLEDMPIAIKNAYIRIVINFLLDDDNEIDSKESAELYKLISRLKFTKEERFELQSFIDTPADTNELIDKLISNLDELTRKEIKMSLTKDLVYIFKIAKGLDYTKSTFIKNIADLMGISDNELELINQSIEVDLKIFDDATDDDALKKGFSNLVSTAGAVGVPLAALYFSGSVVGLGATGITSGLAALGFGGILGFSSMLTGLGAILLIGFGAKKGLEHLTGRGELEKRKLKEGLLLAVNKQLQVSINLLHEDINFITEKLRQSWENAISLGKDNEKNKLVIESLIKRLTIYTNNSRQMVEQHDYVERTAVRQRIPMQIDVEKLQSLTDEPTTKKYYSLVMDCYTQVNGLYTLRNDLSVEVTNNLSEALTQLDYFGVGGMAKQGISKLKGLFS